MFWQTALLTPGSTVAPERISCSANADDVRDQASEIRALKSSVLARDRPCSSLISRLRLHSIDLVLTTVLRDRRRLLHWRYITRSSHL